MARAGTAVGHHRELGQRRLRQRHVRCDDRERRAAQRVSSSAAPGVLRERPAHHLDAVGERAVRTPRAGDDASASPVEHVAGGVDDRERADDDVAELEARGAEPAFHPAEPAAPVHLSDRRAGAGADVAFGDRPVDAARARLVGGLRVGPDPRIADREIVDHRA